MKKYRSVLCLPISPNIYCRIGITMSKLVDEIKNKIEKLNREKIIEYATTSSWKWIFEPLVQKDRKERIVSEFYKNWFEDYERGLTGLVISVIFECNGIIDALRITREKN